jgi:hypothetical protein
MAFPQVPPEHHPTKASSRRSRRLGMVGLATILVTAGLAAVVAANDRSASNPAADVSATAAPIVVGPVTWLTESHTTVDAIWPQQTLAEVEAAQSRANAGDPAYTWELDAREVALRFLRLQLGWPQASAPLHQFQGKGVRRLVYDVSTCAPTITDCLTQLQQGGAQAQITIERLGSEDGGVWAVTEVDDPTLVMNVQPGLQIPDGAPLIGLTLAKEGEAITAGYAYRGPCGARVHAIDSIIASYRVDFTADISAAGAPCMGGSGTSDLPTTGYVFLMTPGRLGGTPFDRRTGGTSLVHFTAIPVTFGAPLALSSRPRYLRWPAAPERRLGKRHTEVVRVKTNLPDGTRIGEYLFSKDLETPAFEMAQGGFIDLGIANNVCHERDGHLLGTTVTVTLSVAPVYPWPGSCPPPGWAGCAGIPQSPAILAILGRHFERATGDHLEAHGSDNWIVTRHTYRFPAKTCTAKIVGGEQIKIDPGA